MMDDAILISDVLDRCLPATGDTDRERLRSDLHREFMKVLKESRDKEQVLIRRRASAISGEYVARARDFRATHPDHVRSLVESYIDAPVLGSGSQHTVAVQMPGPEDAPYPHLWKAVNWAWLEYTHPMKDDL